MMEIRENILSESGALDFKFGELELAMTAVSASSRSGKP
jgi:hypothetical protein